MKPIKKTIKIASFERYVLRNGKNETEHSYHDQPADVYGDWAVFKDGRKWNVTYVPDGLQLRLFPTKKAAVYVATRLAEELKTSPYEATDFMKAVLDDVIIEFGAAGIWER